MKLRPHFFKSLKSPKQSTQKSIAPKDLATPPKKKLKRKLLAIFFIITLVILPSVPSEAAVLDPIIKVILPLYERITGKNKNTDPTAANPATDSRTQEPLPPEPELPTPDLLSLLQAEFAIDRDDPTTALELYKTQALKDNATAVFERALGLSMQLETPDKSLDFAKAWQDKNVDHVPVWFYVTHLALKAQDYPTAAQNLKLILAYDPKADLTQIFAGILPNTPIAQRALFNEIDAIDSHQNPSLSMLKAGLLVQLNEPVSAILHLNNAINTDQNNLAYYILKADILKNEQNPSLEQFLTDAIATTQGDTQKQLYLYHARHLIDQGQLNQAWQVLNSSGKLLTTDSEMALLGALLALDLQDYKNANRLLLALTKFKSTQSEAYYYLGISYERAGQIDKALSYFARVDDMQYILPAVKKQVAYQMLLEHPKKAIASLIALRQKYEMYASESYLLQADVLRQLGKSHEAYELLKQAYDDYPDDPALLYNKITFMNDEDVGKADAIHELLEFDPQNPSYRLLYADFLLHKNPYDPFGKDIILAIANMTPTNPNYSKSEQHKALLMLANLDFEQGHYQQVIDSLQNPYDSEPDLQMGTVLLRAYQKLGNNQKVQDLLQQLQSHFGNPNKAQASP